MVLEVNEKHTAQRYSCDNCGKTYKNQRSVIDHKRIFCGKEPTMLCPMCPKKYFRPYDLNVHIRYSHKLADQLI
ncbi:hypothetical protein J6590_002416 [Homalodisca vitripennis]|nr:hypothetical protein J6590_002416 [Homalodisca vitripennis]